MAVFGKLRMITEAEGDNHIRLRTLIFLRWLAIFGQLGALTIAERWFGLNLPLGASYIALGASVLVNLIFIFVYPTNARLSETGALLTLGFDLAQLCFLSYLTGGLTNPFTLLVLAPVTISATALGLRSACLIGALAIIMVTGLALYSLPLTLPDGDILGVPPLFQFGFWLALVIGILFLGTYSRRVASETRAMQDALLAAQMALAREQKLTDLGGVVAAAAHELGTPLATIKMVATELLDELEDQPDLFDDVILIRDQADRCRDILRGMGRAGKDDLQLRQTAISMVLQEAAEPHVARGKEVLFNLAPGVDGAALEPVILRRPEIIHGLRNLIQNAVDFARSTVWVEAEWTGLSIIVRVVDDGDGYTPDVLSRIGDPFVRARRSEAELARRPGYDGMGLGLFIAKTLLERSGATLTFSNGSDPFLDPEERPMRSGAVVKVVWRKEDILAPRNLTGAENQLFGP